MGLNKAEKLILRMINNIQCNSFNYHDIIEATMKEIGEELDRRFPNSKIPPEYFQAYKRAYGMIQERYRNITNERWQSKNWRDEYETNKAKRH